MALFKKSLVLLSFIAFIFSACGTDKTKINKNSAVRAAPDRVNDISRISTDFKTLFAEIPLAGKLPTLPWSGDYWRLDKGMIALRWQQPGDDAFKRPLLTESEVRKMSKAQLAILSPAEKYDIYVGNFSFKLTRWVIFNSSPTAPFWTGICNGWATAAMFYKEPLHTTVKGPSGIEVPFGADDIKALLSYQASYANLGGSKQIGSNCQSKLDPSCQGLDARALHLTLGNLIGLKKESFMSDVSRGDEIWNHPIHSYNMKIIEDKKQTSPDSAQGTLRELVMETAMTYSVETSPIWNTVVLPVSATKIYKYRLELSENGNIIGSKWLQDDHPDTIILPKKSKLAGYFSALNQIYSDSTGVPPIENEKIKHLGTCAQFDGNSRDCVFVGGFERCFFEDSTNKCLEKTGIDFVIPAR